jgi:hypothetical protein
MTSDDAGLRGTQKTFVEFPVGVFPPAYITSRVDVLIRGSRSASR